MQTRVCRVYAFPSSTSEQPEVCTETYAAAQLTCKVLCCEQSEAHCPSMPRDAAPVVAAWQ